MKIDGEIVQKFSDQIYHLIDSQNLDSPTVLFSLMTVYTSFFRAHATKKDFLQSLDLIKEEFVTMWDVQMKEPITIGRCTMWAEPVPVTLLFNETINAPSFPAELDADNLKIIEMDGIYLVIMEHYWIDKAPTQEYRAFTCRRDAFSYLAMFGIEVKDEQ